MCRSDTSETKTQQKRAFPCATIGTYSLLRFLHALKRQALLFPTLSPPLSPLLQFGFNFQLVSCLVSNIVSCLSPPPRSFAVWRLDIKYLLFVLLSSAVGIGYIVYHNFNNYICEQTELAGKLLLPLRQGRPDGSALNGLPKPFTLPSFVHTF